MLCQIISCSKLELSVFFFFFLSGFDSLQPAADGCGWTERPLSLPTWRLPLTPPVPNLRICYLDTLNSLERSCLSTYVTGELTFNSLEARLGGNQTFLVKIRADDPALIRLFGSQFFANGSIEAQIFAQQVAVTQICFSFVQIMTSPLQLRSTQLS